MSKRIIIIVLGFLPSLIQAQNNGVERDLVLAAVNEYIEGRNNGDVERLKNAFLPSATLKGVSKEKELSISPVAEYITRQTPGKKQNCTSEIGLIDYTNDVAVAQVILKYQTFAYYDYLVLMKIKGKWIIADKINTRKEF